MPAALLLHVGQQLSWRAWVFEPVVISGTFIASVGYLYGHRWMRIPFDWHRALPFYAGLLAIVIALVSPLDVAAERLLSLHMLQHVLLTTIGPPLILLGIPPALLRPLVKEPSLRVPLSVLTNPVLTGALFLVGMWVWHAPQLYNAALNHLQVHQLMHATFITTGLLYWWPVIQPLPEISRMGAGGRLLYLFVSGFPMALLALLLIASSSVVYGYYATVPPLWGISPLHDQQVAGIIMGALGEAAGFAGITLLFFRFLDQEEAQEEAQEALAARTEASPRAG